MAFNGYLIKLGGTEVLPMDYMKAEGYKVTPNQRMESEAKRDITGYLHRTTVQHTASKIEFNTPVLTNVQANAMMSMIRNHWTSVAERKIYLEYYDPEFDEYKTGEFYTPDIDFPINRVDGNLIYYNEIRIAFIEY